MRTWNKLPEHIRCGEVWPYYEELKKHRTALLIKRGMDIIIALLLLLLLSPVMLVISLLVLFTSPGGILFCQRRVTTYGRVFKIYKFRTMIKNAERFGGQVTAAGDARITRAGRFLRKVRLDELPQLVNILKGDMTIVGTRPEVEKYVSAYQKEMLATLLLPAGVTSEASIAYKDEEKLLSPAADEKELDTVYINQILPDKMKYNLDYIKHFSLKTDAKLIFKTVKAVLTREE